MICNSKLLNNNKKEMYLVLILYRHYFNLNLITDISGRYQYFFHLTKEKSKLEKVT